MPSACFRNKKSAKRSLQSITKKDAPFFMEFVIPDGTGVRFCGRDFKGSLTVDVVRGRFAAEPFGLWSLKGLIISVSLISLFKYV